MLMMNVYLWMILMIQFHAVTCFSCGITLDFSVTFARNDLLTYTNAINKDLNK